MHAGCNACWMVHGTHHSEVIPIIYGGTHRSCTEWALFVVVALLLFILLLLLLLLLLLPLMLCVPVCFL